MGKNNQPAAGTEGSVRTTEQAQIPAGKHTARLEAVRTARLAATGILLVVATFFAARVGTQTAARVAARTAHAQSLQQRGASPGAGLAFDSRLFTAPSAKGSHCSLAIPNGQLLQQNGGKLWTERANTLKIENRSGYGLILKFRDMMLGHMRASVFVAKNSSAIYDHIPDGRYVIDYALGNQLDESCTTFSHLVYAGQFGLIQFAAQDTGRKLRYDRQEITIPPFDDQDADINAIGKDVFEFD